MTSYISGPISGFDLDERRKTFAEAAVLVKRVLGGDVVNPMEVVPQCEYQCDPGQLADRPPYIHTWKCWMKYDIIAMLECDTIVMLPGWQDSKGACTERNIAIALGFQVYYASHEGTLHD
jgi:hypothetical protein